MTSNFISWWRNNPEKAEDIRRRRRAQRNDATRAIEREAARLRRAARPSTRTRGPNTPKLVWIAGKSVEYWSVGQVAASLCIGRSTVTQWDRKGVIPQVFRLVDDMGRRWWQAGVIKYMAKRMVDYRAGKISAKELAYGYDDGAQPGAPNASADE